MIRGDLMARLGDICKIKSGYAFKSEQFSNCGVPIIRIGNITNTGLKVEDDIWFDEDFWNNNPNYRVEKNDILIAMSGATVGKCCINTLTDKLLLNQRVASISVKTDVDYKFIYYNIASEKFAKYISEQSVGCAQPNISVKCLAEYEIKAIPKEEQQNIVDVFTQVDDLISNYNQQLEKLDELVKCRFVDMFEDYIYNGINTTLESLCILFTDGDWIESKDQSDKGIRLIQTGNVGNGVFKNKDEKMRFISEDTFISLGCKEILPGDVLVSRLPEPVARACIIPAGLGKMITAVDCSIIRFDERIIPEYFVAYTQTKTYQKQIETYVTGSTRKRISRKNLGSVKVPIPPMKLQNEFATFVEQIDKAKSQINQSLEKLETLKKSLMQQYFG